MNTLSYEILVEGHLAPQWVEWFDGMTVTQQPDGRTRLAGKVVDQAALFGLLGKVRDLGLALVSVKPCE
jgi:hypothetical protein